MKVGVMGGGDAVRPGYPRNTWILLIGIDLAMPECLRQEAAFMLDIHKRDR